jgi:site-specific DNA-methyltransferase (adenine-specific)
MKAENTAKDKAVRNSYMTPKKYFDPLNKVFNFKIDVAASKENTLCNNYFDLESNGLDSLWGAIPTDINKAPDWVWCNPPYGRGELVKWCKKAALAFYKGEAQTIMLIPASMESEYFHDWVYMYSRYICFIKGRIRFVGAKNGAFFPSVYVVWGVPNSKQIEALEQLGHVVET